LSRRQAASPTTITLVLSRHSQLTSVYRVFQVAGTAHLKHYP